MKKKILKTLDKIKFSTFMYVSLILFVTSFILYIMHFSDISSYILYMAMLTLVLGMDKLLTTSTRLSSNINESRELVLDAEDRMINLISRHSRLLNKVNKEIKDFKESKTDVYSNEE